MQGTQTPRPPTRIGPYRIIERLGSGGMGVVYRGEHTTTGSPAAIKTVEVLAPSRLAGLRREVDALTRIRHPGIVHILAQGVEHGCPWYAMDLLGGETLLSRGSKLWSSVSERSRTVSMPWNTDPPATGEAVRERAPAEWSRSLPPWAAGGSLPLLNTVRQLALTLAHVHGEGVVHGDLKPENVFLRPDGMPVLVDFGLTSHLRGVTGRESLEPTRGMAGTPAYMSPEQIRGELLDARTDLYSLGVILYWLVTGRRPFEGSQRALFEQHLSAPVPPPSALVGDFPRELELLILRMLAKDRNDRLGYAEDVAAVLDGLGTGPAAHGSLPAPRPYLYQPEFVGRTELLSRFEEWSQGPGQTPGSLVFLSGESGIGKTRLAMEVTRRTLDRRVIVAECQTASSGAPGGLRSAPLLV